MKLVGLLLIASLAFGGCAPAAFTPMKAPVIEFEKTPPYEFDWESLKLPPKMKRKFVDENMQPVSKDKAKYILIEAKEYAKIVSLLEIIKQSKEIIGEQVILINTNVRTINALKEYIALEQAKTESYRELWVNSENAYRQERYAHKTDNAINKATNIIISIGSVLIAILAF